VRLFYDVSSSRLRAELALLAADAGAITTVVLFAAGAAFSGAEIPDLALLVVWSAMPVAIARVLRGVEIPREPWRRMLPSAILGLSLAGLIVLGLELIRSVAPGRSVPETGLATVLFLAWGSGVLLFYPRAYRLHDFLLLATMLLALKEGRAPHVFMPLFLAFFFLQSFLRHAIHDILPPQRRDAPVNLQNARMASLGAAAAAALVFAAAGLAWSACSKALPGRGLPPGPAAAPARKAPAQKGGGTAREAPERGVFVWEPPEGGLGDYKSGTTVGFSHRVGLRELTSARSDPREVLGIELLSGEPAIPAGTLWRGIALTTFDPRMESWVEEVEAARRIPWPRGRVLRRPAQEKESSGAVTLRATIVTPVLRSLVVPYGTLSITAGFPEYAETLTADVFPHPRPGAGASYDLAVDDRTWGLFSGPAAGLPGGTAGCLAVPSQAEIGLDIERLARSVFKPGSASLAGRMLELEGWFGAEGFRYANAAGWRGKHPLARFLLEEKAGDCTYYATAGALLFRAAGVPARVAAGFIGGELRGKAIVLAQKDAHAWVEVHDPRRGWTPVDPTAWVPADPTYVPEPEPVPEPSRRGAVFGPLESSPSPFTDWASAAERDDSPNSRREVEALPDEAPRKPPAEPAGDFALTESMPRDDEESWVAFSEYVLPEDGELVDGEPEALRGATSDPRGRKEAGAPDRGWMPVEEPPLDMPAGLPAPLRLALAAAGGIVALLVFRAFLRPGRDKDEEDASETLDDALEPIEPIAAISAGLDESDPRDRVLAEYLRLQEALARTRKHRRPAETPLEHARAAGRGERRARKPFVDLYRILYRLVYGSDTIDENDASSARESCRKLKRLLG